MAADNSRLRAARSIRFGPLDRASARFDRERAETAIREWTPTRRGRVIWADGPTESVKRAAGQDSDPARVPVVRLGWGDSRLVLGGNPEYERISEVARLDRQLLAAARHKAASAVPAEKRLAFRMSIPAATLVSGLAEDAVLNPSGTINEKARAMASALSKAGVFAVWFLARDTVIAVPRPELGVADGQLHSLDRPSARWSGENLWFWHGVWIPDRLATRRDKLGLADVLGERNVERRRILIEVIGFENFLQAATGDVPAQQDDYGRLWRLGRLLDDEEYVAVEVVNSTPEQDGSFRHYFLRVPPATKTARDGVAWTFAMNATDYTVAAQS